MKLQTILLWSHGCILFPHTQSRDERLCLTGWTKRPARKGAKP